MGTLKKIIFQLDLHQRVLITLILPQCLSTQTIPLSPNIGFWIPLSVFKLSTQYPYYSQFFQYSVKNTLIDHNACSPSAQVCLTFFSHLCSRSQTLKMDTYKEEKEGAGVLAFLEMSFEISGKMSTNPRKKSNFPSLSLEFERHSLEKRV